MKKTAEIVRFDLQDLNNLDEWEQMDYALLVSGEPVQRGRVYHEIAEQGYMVGVWDCTPFTDRMMPYSVDEYMLFLEGELTMIMPDATEVHIQSGDAFVIPKGFNCQWKQNGFVHKIFMIVDGSVLDANNASLKRISVPDFDLRNSKNSLITSRTEFLNAAGTMRVNVQLYDAMSHPSLACEEHLLISVLDGTLTLNNGQGAHVFSKGQTAYVYQGGLVDWTTTKGTKILLARYANFKESSV